MSVPPSLRGEVAQAIMRQMAPNSHEDDMPLECEVEAADAVLAVVRERIEALPGQEAAPVRVSDHPERWVSRAEVLALLGEEQ